MRELHLRLDAGNTRHVEAFCVDGRRVQEYGLSDPRLPAHDQHTVAITAGGRQQKVWDDDELRTFLAKVADGRWFPAMRLAAMTGMRRAEVLGVRWADIDFAKCVLTVRQTLLTSSYSTHFDTAKNHKPRTVDLDPITIQVLGRLRRIQKEERLAADGDYLRSDLVFTNADGSLVHPDTFSQAFERLVGQTSLTRITLHGLRQSHATPLLKAGVSVTVVSERLGHSDPGFTLRIYAHVLPSMQAEAVNKVAAIVDR
jgi:integrase